MPPSLQHWRKILGWVTSFIPVQTENTIIKLSYDVSSSNLFYIDVGHEWTAAMFFQVFSVILKSQYPLNLTIQF